MQVDPSRFPFVAEFIEQRFGTLYVLSDSPVRVRDGVSVVALTRFFAASGVRLDVRPVVIGHRRYLSAHNIKAALDAKREEELDKHRQEGADYGTLIDKVFGWAEERAA